MAKGTVKTWNGQIAKITSDDYKQLIFAKACEFERRSEPSIGDELVFKVKKRKQNGETVLYAKSIKFTNSNPHMLSTNELQKNASKETLISIISVIVLVLAVVGLAYFGYQYYQQQQVGNDFTELSEETILVE